MNFPDKLDELNEVIDKVSYLFDSWTDRNSEIECEVFSLEEEVNKLEECVSLCQLCVDDQSDAKGFAEQMLTSALNRIFPEYEMKFVFEPVYKSDNVTLNGYRLSIEEHGVLQDVKHAHGFGVLDVICLFLRIIFLKMTDNLTPFIIFDESLAFVNYSKYEVIIDLLREIHELENIQIVFITNNKIPDDYVTHQVTKSGKVSTITSRS